MSATNAFETSLLGLIFTNVEAANVGDATGLRGSTTAGSFWISLHTASSGEAGNQATNETAYGSYVRQAVARSTSGWTVTGDTVDNDAQINFPEATSGPSFITHFGIGSNETTAGNLFFHGATSGTLVVNTAVQPFIAIGALDVSLD